MRTLDFDSAKLVQLSCFELNDLEMRRLDDIAFFLCSFRDVTVTPTRDHFFFFFF